MATHAIGRNNALVGICIKKPVKTLLGQAATAEDRSLASFVLHHAMENIRRINPEMAAKIAAASVHVVLILTFLSQMFSLDQVLARRMARKGRRQEVECIAQLLGDMEEEA